MASVLKKGSVGDDVKRLQAALNLAQDGIFGSITEEAVKDFQSANDLYPDGIVGEKTWAVIDKKNCNLGVNLVKSKRTIKEIIVHCTATPEGRNETVESIRAMHKTRGFADIGYHYLIYIDGSIHNGRDVNIIGAHCVNHNSYSIGVCYVGGCDKNLNAKDTRTDAQKKALVDLLKQLRVLYPNAKIYGHRNFSSKKCPSFDARNEYKSI